jgi:hypothetical protein
VAYGSIRNDNQRDNSALFASAAAQQQYQEKHQALGAGGGGSAGIEATYRLLRLAALTILTRREGDL